MSDEPVQPSLRLKPRQTPPPATPEPVALPTEIPAEPAPSPTDPFRLRLKPKAPPPEGSPEASFATPVPFSSPPIPPAEISPVSNETPPEPPVESAPRAPTPPPTQKAPQFSPPKPQYVPTPHGLTDPVDPSTKAPASAIKADKWLAGIFLFVLVIAAAIYGFRILTKNHPKPPAHTATSAPAASVAPEKTPAQSTPKLAEKPISAAGKAIAKARDVVAAHDKLEKEQGVASVLEEPAAPVDPKSATEPSRGTNAPVIANQPVAAPAVSEPEPPPQPSEVFRNYIIGLRVSGVFQGENARALLNGKMYHLGDVLDPVRKIEFYKIDPEAKQLIFRDDTGAIVSRHY